MGYREKNERNDRLAKGNKAIYHALQEHFCVVVARRNHVVIG